MWSEIQITNYIKFRDFTIIDIKVLLYDCIEYTNVHNYY